MKDNKKIERGLEEIAHLFLSRQSSPGAAKGGTQREVRAGGGESTRLPGNNQQPKEVKGVSFSRAVSSLAVKQNLCLLSSSRGLFAEKSFVACNLAIELASRDFSVGLIETTTTLPNALFLLGSSCSGPASRHSKSPVAQQLPMPEPLKLMDIPVDPDKNIRAIFVDEEVELDDSSALFYRLNSQSDFLIMNASVDVFRLRKIISLTRPFFIVTTTVNSRELLKSYLLIKQVSQDVGGEFGLLIVGESPSYKAKGAFRMVSEMAQKFLSARIHYMGTVPIGADFSRSILIRTPLLHEMQDSAACQSIRKLADGLIKKTQLSSEGNHRW